MMELENELETRTRGADHGIEEPDLDDANIEVELE